MSSGPASGPSGRRGAAFRSVAVGVAVASAVLGPACWPLTAGAGAATTTGATTTAGGTAATGSTGSTGARSATVLGQPVPVGTGTLEAVSCGSPRDCWAVGLARAGVLDEPAGTSTDPSAVVIDATDDGGATWKTEKVAGTDPTNLTGIACPDRRHCMAVGTVDSGGTLRGAVLVTSDGGRRWRSTAAPAGSVDLSAVQCTTAGDCLVLATGGSTYWSASTIDGGKAWQRDGTLPAGFGGPSNVTCTGAQICMTAGYTPATPGRGAGAIAVTTDGGATWAAATLPPGAGLLHDIACADAFDCTAVGTKSTTLTDVAQGQGEMLASTDGGTTWTTVAAPAGVDDAFGIACPTTTGCAAVGTVWTSTSPPTPVGGVVTTVDGGSTWHAPVSRYVPVGLTGVDCPTATSCVAAGNDLLARIALPTPTRAKH